MFKTPDDLSDVISLAVYCPQDSTILLALEANINEYWLPCSRIVNESWQSQCSKDIDNVFGLPITNYKLLRLYKVWIPNHNVPYIFHCVYHVPITGDQKKKIKSNYGKYRGRVRWVQENEIVKLMFQENLRSPEIIEVFRLCKGGSAASDTGDSALPIEISSCGNLIEVADRIFISSTTDGNYEQLTQSAHFSKEVQVWLYKEFLFYCFPAIYMCQQVFSRFIMLLGWSREDAPSCFRSADLSNRSGLSYRDFVYVLAAMEPITSHGGVPAEIRCRYIFRFFDRDKDGFLSYEEFKNLTLHIRKSKKQSVDAPGVSREAEVLFKGLGLSLDKNLSLVEFLRAVGDLKLRGTSQIFRSPISVVQHIQECNKEIKNKSAKSPLPTKIETKTLVVPLKTKQNSTPYELGEHVVRLQKSGTLITIDEIWNMGTAVSQSATRQVTLSDLGKRLSQDQFSQTSISNEVLKSLRYLMQVNVNRVLSKNPKTGKQDPFLWGQLDLNLYARNFMTICTRIRDIFKTEPRLLLIQSPVYILGDLHGNFTSLLYFEKVLWHLGPGLCPSNILFLGDYVDRGPHSMEVISYLFSYKIQNPNKLYLIRGNHEIREIQKMFTFYTECLHKFGEKVGVDVWNSINAAFDTMPIAASIDGKIFCCHGGIPPPWLCPNISSINAIPCPLTNPDDQSSLAWEIMWNDPISKTKQISDDIALELVANDGFALNTRRGTAHFFSVEALERFLNNNGFSHLIRAHEVAQAGFNVLLKGKLLTVFSSSKYCGGANEAACVLADQGKLRILRLEPT